MVQDLALVLDLVLDGESLLVDPTTAFRYRRHRASVSSAHAADGRRFAEERAFFAETADRMAARGWPRAARAARQHVSSRINALTQLPSRSGTGGRPGCAASPGTRSAAARVRGYPCWCTERGWHYSCRITSR